MEDGRLDHVPGDPPSGEGAIDAPLAPRTAQFVELLGRALDEGASRWAGRPVKVATKVSPRGLLRGQLETVRIELQGVAAGPLFVDRLVVKGRNVRVAPGLPPRLQAKPVELRAHIGQASLDEWVGRTRLPFRLVLRDHELVAKTGIGGWSMGELAVEPIVEGQWLRLQPQSASVLGVSNPLIRLMRGYLPLPPLPAGLRLTAVEVVDGEALARFVLDELDEPLTPELADRLRTRLRLPGLPGFAGRA